LQALTESKPLSIQTIEAIDKYPKANTKNTIKVKRKKRKRKRKEKKRKEKKRKGKSRIQNTNIIFFEKMRNYNFTATKNAEIRLRWYTLCIKANHTPIFPHVVEFLTGQGRMKFVRPLYRYKREGGEESDRRRTEERKRRRDRRLQGSPRFRGRR
jgi:hypothetical protein